MRDGNQLIGYGMAGVTFGQYTPACQVKISISRDGLDRFSPIGAKGLGEVGIVGVSAAIANAVYHATGRRIRSLPITLDKLL